MVLMIASILTFLFLNWIVGCVVYSLTPFGNRLALWVREFPSRDPLARSIVSVVVAEAWPLVLAIWIIGCCFRREFK